MMPKNIWNAHTYTYGVKVTLGKALRRLSKIYRNKIVKKAPLDEREENLNKKYPWRKLWLRFKCTNGENCKHPQFGGPVLKILAGKAHSNIS